MSTLRAFDVYVKRQVEQLIVIPVNAKDEKEAAKFVNLGIADLDNVEVVEETTIGGFNIEDVEEN